MSASCPLYPQKQTYDFGTGYRLAQLRQLRHVGRANERKTSVRLLKSASERVLVLGTKREDIRHFLLGFFAREGAADSFPLIVDEASAQWLRRWTSQRNVPTHQRRNPLEYRRHSTAIRGSAGSSAFVRSYPIEIRIIHAVGQLGDIRRNPARLILRQQLRR